MTAAAINPPEKPPEKSSNTDVDTPSKSKVNANTDRAIYRRGRQAKEVERLNDVNSKLAERNEKLLAEVQQLREALDKYLFTKASDISSNDVLIPANKFAQLFIMVRDAKTEAIICQVSEDGKTVVSVIPKLKEIPA